jgi:ABC-type transport system substrate-binding protein
LSPPALSKIANVRTVGGIVFPGSPLAATKEELQHMTGFWPDIDKSRAEAKRLLKEAGQENLTFELLNRNVDQPYKYVGTWIVDEWSKIGVHATQKVVPTGPWFEALCEPGPGHDLAGQVTFRRAQPGASVRRGFYILTRRKGGGPPRATEKGRSD